MTAAAFYIHLSRQGVAISSLDSGLEIEADEGILTNELLAQIQKYKADLLRLLAPISCTRCAETMETSGPYHFWCSACRVDVHLPIPKEAAAYYCTIFHDPVDACTCPTHSKELPE